MVKYKNHCNLLYEEHGSYRAGFPSITSECFPPPKSKTITHGRNRRPGDKIARNCPRCRSIFSQSNLLLVSLLLILCWRLFCGGKKEEITEVVPPCGFMLRACWAGKDIFPSMLKEKRFSVIIFNFMPQGLCFNNLFVNIGYNLRSKEYKGGKI